MWCVAGAGDVLRGPWLVRRKTGEAVWRRARLRIGARCRESLSEFAFGESSEKSNERKVYVRWGVHAVIRFKG
jgi:hypothetical protein